MAFKSVTSCLMVAYERECKGLTCLERGALWTLTALAQCRWAGEDGIVRAEIDALKAEMGFEGCLADVLKGLQRKGRIRILNDEDGRIELKVCFWYDMWWNERQRMMARRYKNNEEKRG